MLVKTSLYTIFKALSNICFMGDQRFFFHVIYIQPRQCRLTKVIMFVHTLLLEVNQNVDIKPYLLLLKVAQWQNQT